jgi:integrase/recombinase XerD
VVQISVSKRLRQSPSVPVWVMELKVENYYVQKRRGWIRFHEKGGKVTELPCHHNLDQYLEEWITASGLAGEPEAPLFPTLHHGRLTDRRP